MYVIGRRGLFFNQLSAATTSVLAVNSAVMINRSIKAISQVLSTKLALHVQFKKIP